jgi:hypothetical protein
MYLFWTFKLSFGVDILALLATVWATFIKLGNLFSNFLVTLYTSIGFCHNLLSVVIETVLKSVVMSNVDVPVRA